MRAGGHWDALTDLRSERQLESETSLTEAAIANSASDFPQFKGAGFTPVA